MSEQVVAEPDAVAVELGPEPDHAQAVTDYTNRFCNGDDDAFVARVAAGEAALDRGDKNNVDAIWLRETVGIFTRFVDASVAEEERRYQKPNGAMKRLQNMCAQYERNIAIAHAEEREPKRIKQEEPEEQKDESPKENE